MVTEDLGASAAQTGLSSVGSSPQAVSPADAASIPSASKRFAYADPPYLGRGEYYRALHPDAMSWNDPETHRALIERLQAEFPDGWAMSLSERSLRTILPMCPPDARVAAWISDRPRYAGKAVPVRKHFEPVIFMGIIYFTPSAFWASFWLETKGYDMSKSTISTFELFAMIPDQETARTYLEARLWPNGPTCPVCGLGERITTRKGGYYRCNQCKEDFTVRTGTIFERSHVPLHKWVYAMYLLVTARKGISSLQLAKEIGITQKSAWFVLHRLREACGTDLGKLSGIVEIDETYVGGIEKNKHESKKLRLGRGAVGKTAVLAMRERGGRTVGFPIASTDAGTIKNEIHRRIEIGSTLHTDEASVYQGMDGLFYRHETINHTAGEYRRGDVTTNGIESVFAVLKRGLIGVYHHASPKHLGRYVNEFAFRLNEGDVKRHTLARLDSFITASAGKRLTYGALVA